jgi:DDE superfamily endonuclease
MKSKYDFPNLVGIADGTILPLEYKLGLCGDDYLCCKGCYAVNSLLVCDNQLHVHYMIIGYAGSTHDNRVWTNSKMFLNSMAYFCNNQYLLGDSAFLPGAHMVPSYKKLPGKELSVQQEWCNAKIAKPRIKSEHYIGLIKGKFQYFKCICVQIHEKKDMRRIICLFTCAVILHNLVVWDLVPADWELRG